MGFVDDYANYNIKNTSTIRKKDGDTVYSNPLENETKPKRRVTKNNRKRYRGERRAFFVLALFLTAVIAVSVPFIIHHRSRMNDSVRDTLDAPSAGEQKPTSQSAPDTEDIKNEAAKTNITLSAEDVHKGNLILVNYMYKYVFPTEDVLVSMYDKNSIYSVNSTEIYLQKEALDSFNRLVSDLYDNSGCDDILVVSAYRSVEKQEEIYQDRLERFGSEYAAAYVANPGYSEHHTALAMDLQIYTGGAAYDIDTYEKCAWFNSNYDQYGYVLRYPGHKSNITFINNEGWHYRYVGLPHSLIMDKLDLCLEEYTDYLKDFTFENPLVYNKNTGEITKGGAVGDLSGNNLYIIYYIPSSGEITEVPVIEGRTYTVSGNNVDGFVLTYSPG